MEVVQRPAQTVLVYPNRLFPFIKLCMLTMVFLFVLGLDTFVAWLFWTNHNIDESAYIVIAILLSSTILIGGALWWSIATRPSQLRKRPFLTIDAQGLSVEFGYTSILHVGKVLIPWEEIEWMAVLKSFSTTYFSISLKNPSFWWANYGNGEPHRFPRDFTTRAHFNIAQSTLRTPVRQILHLIEQNYNEELVRSHVHIVTS